MKTGLDTLGTAPNESKIAKHEKRDLTPFEPSKKISGAQNMKMRSDALGTA
jgi:hypothetical protein